MDTLSRKHRLRQQQQQPQFHRTNHQMLFETTCEGKENQLLRSRQQHFSSSSEDYDLNFSVTSHNSNNNTNNINDNGEEQFRVFRLVEIGQQQQQRVGNGKGGLQKEIPEKIIHTQQRNDQQFNSNKADKSFPGDSFCSISITRQQQQQKKRQQQVCEVRKSSYRDSPPLNINQKNNHQYRDDNDGCDKMFQSSVYEPILEKEDKTTSKVHRQKNRHKHYQREKQLQVQKIHEQQNVALLSNEMNGSERSTSCSTTRSNTAYSSGFASEESGDRFNRTTGNNECDSDNEDNFDVDVGFAARCANKLRQHSRERSRVIADLDRLMLNAGRCSTSPAESYLSSCGANSSMTTTTTHIIGDSNINNTNEFDYSTLCRDEFSSFIAVQPNNNCSNNNNTNNNNNSELLDDAHVSSVKNNNQQQRKERIKPTKQQLQQRNVGPVLVGIHHQESNDVYTELSIDSSQSSNDSYCDEQDDAYELQEEEEIESSSSCITNSSKNDTDPSIDKEMVVINHNQHDLRLIKRIPEKGDNLSQMLDIYLDRVESLLKLSRGDKSISFEKTFGEDNEIKVSDEFKTRIEFSPISQNQAAAAATRVIQELKMIESDEEGISQSDKGLCQLERKIIDVDFETMLLSSPQTSATLNWDHEDERIELPILKSGSLENSEDSSEQRGQLEVSLLNRFLELDEFKFLRRSLDTENLVNSIRRHISEFVDDYNNYQRELKAKTTFASDWHQNWLFAFKRPNELGCPSRNGGTKRAKMSDEIIKNVNSTLELDLVTEGSTMTNHIDLIKYSTLLLDKFKPVKLTYLTLQSHLRDKNCPTNGINSNESIEACYEAQEERLKELHCLALESSRQTDVCRMLLCDFDNDDDYYDEGDDDNDHNGNYGKQRCRGSRKKKILTKKRRALLISYNSSLLVQKCSGNKFTFSSYGYLFQCNLPAAETSHLSRNMTRRIREEILSKLQQKVEFKDKQFRNYDNCFTARDKVEFLVGIGKNIELINALPVIQFCIKVSGLLPIKVRWFKQASDEENDNNLEEEISSIYVSQRGHSARRRSLKVKEGLIDGARLSWPIEMQANFDYEYQNQWSSWFRFRRCQDDILFEIRDAHLEKDYDKNYKCVVENYCSREECNFTLTRREISSSISGSKENVMNDNMKKYKNHALLRTWSQRTLHKPQPQTTRQPVTNECVQSKQLKSSSSHNDSFCRPKSQAIENSSLEVNNANLEVVESKQENGLLNKRCFGLQTVGRLSATVAATEEDKFGSEFPYHPENLLKRLEQNKFSVPLKYKLQAQNNSLLIDKTSTMEIDTVKGTILERQQVVKENLSPTISPQIQSKNESQFSKFDMHEQVVECELQEDQREQKFDEELRKEKDNKLCVDMSQRQSREFPRRENNNKKKKLNEVEEDGGLNEDDSTNESANSFIQTNQNEETQQRVSNNINNDCGQIPKPRQRQLANKQIVLVSSQQPEHQQQLSRFTELSSHGLNQIDGQQQDLRRQLDPVTAAALHTAGSQQPPPRQILNLQGKVCEQKQQQQQLQRPAMKVKPRVSAKASSLSGAVDSDCIPKASVRSLISRFS